MRAGGGTYMSQALESAINVVESRIDKTRNASILFFTDGQHSPDSGDPLAHMSNLKNERNIRFPIHTYGFGQYDRINTLMLYKMSV
jgi:uncharacterized protein with von Willebrand factor type A (vWA) domain